jgi:4-hydroxy-2-oxoheptanedioate aldolase
MLLNLRFIPSFTSRPHFVLLKGVFVRHSRVRQKLKAGKPVLFTKINTIDPVVVDLIGLLGFDCVWLCNEHIAMDWDRLAHLTRTAAMNDMDLMVRTSKGSYSDLIRPLELGVSGLMIPHCMSTIEAREIVRNTRFHPVGRRPLDGGNSDGQYCMLPLGEYLRLANENTFIMVQLEDPEALEHVDGIAELEGIDGLFVGPSDLAQGLGVPGELNHPKIEEAIHLVAKACQKAGKTWGLPVSFETAPKYLELGARFLSSGADVLGLQSYFRNLRDSFKGLGFEFSQRI